MDHIDLDTPIRKLANAIYAYERATHPDPTANIGPSSVQDATRDALVTLQDDCSKVLAVVDAWMQSQD